MSRFCTTTRGRLACLARDAKEDGLICVLYGGGLDSILTLKVAIPVNLRHGGGTAAKPSREDKSK
jgi:hypothetical protein